MPTGPTSLVHWLGGYDLAGVGALTEIADVTEGEFRGVTPLGPEGAIEHEAPLGRIKYALTESGHLRENQRSLRRLLAGRTEGHPSVVGHFGGAVGAAAVVASSMRIKKSSIPPDMNDFTKLALEYASERPCDIFDGAVFVHGGQRVTHDAPAAPYDGFRFDGSASSLHGGALCILVDPDIVWRGAESLTVEMAHANALAGPWLTTTGSDLLVPADGNPGQLFVRLAGAIRRYIAVRWTWGAQSTFSIDHMAGYAIGTTVMHLDARVANESMLPGDQFTIGARATVHTVSSGGIHHAAAGTEFDVTFTPATLALHNNNTLVTTVARDDRSFKFLSAWERF